MSANDISAGTWRNNCPFCGGTGRAESFYGHKDFVHFRLRIRANTDAWICLTGPATQESIDKLILMLETQKECFPTAAELLSPPPITSAPTTLTVTGDGVTEGDLEGRAS